CARLGYGYFWYFDVW
nr:immunoglobulin heavy chain junction region [Mus musculus]NSM04629.1 immunoglobulin heavy chain junction region [Mus musculus]NSM06441.1 immunoglobulin heavy chain junction region [Mus musculus]